MLPKEQFLASVRHEIGICQHLFSKLEEGQFAYRAGEESRSIEDVLRYLTYCGTGTVEALINGDWSAFGQRAGNAKTWPIAEFPAAMDRQMAEITELLSDCTDADLQQKTGRMPWGEEQALGQALVNSTLKFLTAYRMQLFLYAKQSGCFELKTINCWYGQDALEKVPA